MRCLTLADALRAKGAQCRFISRAHPGHLMDVFLQRGYRVNSLVTPMRQVQAAIKNDSATVLDMLPTQLDRSTHATWLGSTWQTDAEESAAVLASQQADWLVVDHYALDHRWETALKPHYKKLMVIDDLADRIHYCDLLLDQNLYRKQKDYLQ